MEAFRLLQHRFSPTPKIICALKKIHPSATIHLLLMLYFFIMFKSTQSYLAFTLFIITASTNNKVVCCSFAKHLFLTQHFSDTCSK